MPMSRMHPAKLRIKARYRELEGLFARIRNEHENQVDKLLKILGPDNMFGHPQDNADIQRVYVGHKGLYRLSTYDMPSKIGNTISRLRRLDIINCPHIYSYVINTGVIRQKIHFGNTMIPLPGYYGLSTLEGSMWVNTALKYCRHYGLDLSFTLARRNGDIG